MNIKDVLIIAYVFPPIAYVGTYRTLRFCKYLPESGWIPHVLTVNFMKDLDNDPSLLDQVPGCAKVYRTPIIDFWRKWNSYKRNRDRQSRGAAKMPGSSGKESKKSGLSLVKKCIWELLTIPDHMVFWIPFALTKGAHILKGHDNIRVIYTTSPPHSEHITGLILSRMFHKPWIADFRDPMLDSSGFTPASALRAWVDRKLERAIVRHAGTVIIISDYYRELMARRYPEHSHKFITLPNGYDPTDYAEVPAERFEKFTIIYSGSFYANRTPTFFLSGFHSWYKRKSREQQKNIQVIFYGLPSPEIQGFVRKNSLESAILSPGLIPKKLLMPQLKGADLLLLIIGFDQESRGTITSKLFEYLACRRPILAIMPEGNALDILKSGNSYYWVSSENEQLLHSCLDQAYEKYLDGSSGPPDDPASESDRFNAKNQTRVLADLFSSQLQNSKKLSPPAKPVPAQSGSGGPERFERTGFPPPRE